MKLEIGSGQKDKIKLLEILLKELGGDKDNQAYERNIFYVLNACRRGALAVIEKDNALIFAKDYDKKNSYSLIFFSNPLKIDKETILRIIRSYLKKDLFIHHLFEKRATQLAEEFGGRLVIGNEKIIGSYIDEDTFPQIIYPIKDLPNFGNSVFLKKKNMLDLLSKNSKTKFQDEILQYMNSSQRDVNEPEIFTMIIEKESLKNFEFLIGYITNKVISNWVKNKDVSAQSKEYYIEPIKNLISLLKNKEIISRVNSKVIFRAVFDIKINGGGFWIGEFIPNKSLLIPHIIMTDYYYKDQYKFLLYDIIEYAYTKNFSYVNLGGSEDEKLYDTKSLLKDFFHNKNIERKVHSVYLPFRG